MNDHSLIKQSGGFLVIFKKMVTRTSSAGVHMANGIIRFQKVQLNVHSFATDGIIIDAGGKSLKPLLLDFWKKQSIDALYCTHIHEDHTGCADWFERELQVPIYLNKRSLREAQRDGKYPLYRLLYWGKRKAFAPVPMPTTFHSRNCSWLSIFTPGHSNDHTALLNKTTGQLFSGDLYVQTKTKVAMESESVPQIIQSLKTVLTYDFEEVFCCHAGYLPNGRKHLEDKLHYLQDTAANVHDLNQKGLSVKEIQTQLFPRKYPITTFSYGQWDSKHIITSILQKKT